MATLPAGIRSTNQLFWYKDSESRHYPCRVCERTEARIHLNLEPFWDDNEACLIQVLDFPPSKPFSGRDRLVVDLSMLTPYNGVNSNKKEWSRTIFKTYSNERRLEATRQNMVVITSDIYATYPYLERIRKAAKAVEASADENSDGDSRGAKEGDSDMEIPYNENLGVEGGFRLQDFSDKKTEPLRPGDIIQYTSPIFVFGDRRGQRIAMVISTDPNREPMLVLDSGDVLPDNIIIKRVQVLEKGRLFPHQGCARCIEKFILKKRALKGDFSFRAGIKKESDRIACILDKNMNAFQKRAEADGFAPMDMMNYAQRKLGPSDPQKHKVGAKMKQKVPHLTIDLTEGKRTKHFESDSKGSIDRKEVGRVNPPMRATKSNKGLNINRSNSDSSSFSKTTKVLPKKESHRPHQHSSDTESSMDVKQRHFKFSRRKKKATEISFIESDSPYQQRGGLEVVSSSLGSRRPQKLSTFDDETTGDSDSTLEALELAKRNIASTQQQQERLEALDAALESSKNGILLVSSTRNSPQSYSPAGFCFTKHNAVKAPIAKTSLNKLSSPIEQEKTKLDFKTIKNLDSEGIIDDEVHQQAVFGSSENEKSSPSGRNECVGLTKTREKRATSIWDDNINAKRTSEATKPKSSDGSERLTRTSGQQDLENLSFQTDGHQIKPFSVQVKEESVKKFPKRTLIEVCNPRKRNNCYGELLGDELWDSSDTDHRIQRNKPILKRLKKSNEREARYNSFLDVTKLGQLRKIFDCSKNDSWLPGYQYQVLVVHH